MLDYLGLYQTLFAVLVLTLAGRFLLGGRMGPGMQLLAGWGAFCLVMTLIGTATRIPLGWPAIAFVLFSAAGLKRFRGQGSLKDDMAEAGRVLALALPLLAVMASVAPSQLDIFSLMLPNAAYLFDHGVFPRLADAGPAYVPSILPFENGPFFAHLPVAPYNTELIPLLGSLAGGGFAANLLSLFNILLHLAAALLFARAAAGPDRRPGWPEAALGFALASLFNPGFVPRISFSGMGEAPIAIVLLFAGHLCADALEEQAAGRGRTETLVGLGLVLAALVNIKQQSFGVLLALFFSMLIVAGLDRRAPLKKRLLPLVLAVLPALALYADWRVFVLMAFPGGELKAAPLSSWDLASLPEILGQIGHALIEKPFFAASLLALLAAGANPGRFSPRTNAVVRLAILTSLFFNAYLLLAFLGHFRREHSYFRYMTELTLLVDLALLLAAREFWADRIAAMPNLRRRGGLVIALLMLAAPPLFIPLLRFDRDMPQPRLRQLAAQAAAELPDGGKLAVIMPGDNNSAAIALDSQLRFAGRRHRSYDLMFYLNGGQDALDRASNSGYSLALISCTENQPLSLPAQSAALVEYRNGAWVAVKIWPYETAPKHSKWGWTEFLAHRPFCLE